MNTKVIVKSHEYYDSVRLMQAAARVRREIGVEEAMLMMATDSNKRLLEIAGLLTDEATNATPNDLVIAVVAADEHTAARALQQIEAMLQQRVGVADHLAYRTLDTAMAAQPNSNLALISVPGEYAAAEATRALERGLHVMLFSDNVALVEEVRLKKLALDNGLLMMGPDCGTALIHGVALGFANAVRRGPVGIVGASGTGIQEISVLLDKQGVGVSHAIGTGGRDLSLEVGGMTMLAGIELLAADPDTKVLVLTSKPPHPEVSATILERVTAYEKPVIVNFLGGDPNLVTAAGAVPAVTLEEAAVAAVRLLERESILPLSRDIDERAVSAAAKLAPPQRFVRGLFSGGTLCYEALLLLGQELNAVYSNIAANADHRLQDSWRSRGHTVVDLGADEFTQGRPHPMIDSTLRARRLQEEARDPETAVLLFDVVLGYGAQDDPSGSLVGAIRQARAEAIEDGRDLAFVAYVCGTTADPQDLAQQQETLRAAGVFVMDSNARASQFAGRIAAQAAPDKG